MILGENVGSVYNRGREIQKVYSHGKLVWEKEIEDIDYSVRPFTVKAVSGGSSVWLAPKKHNSIDEKPVLDFKYSINGGDWIETTTRTEIKLNKNDTVSIIATDIESCMIRGDELNYLSDISGNIMSLLYGDDFVGQVVWQKRGERYDSDGFFANCDIRNARNLILPATTLLGEDAYSNMFRGCSSLLTAPELPATTLTPYCYEYMFGGCSSLSTAPELPATTLAVDCYNNMFCDCSSLSTAPELPATTLAESCYQSMFRLCSSLSTAPELPATTLVELCYASMFYGCISLKYIKCFATENISNEAGGSVIKWTYGINTNGKLVCKQVDGGKNPLEDYIPSTWTVEYF